MAEANMIDSHCHEIAEEIAKLLPEKEDQAMRVLDYLREVVEKHFAEAAAALPPSLIALLSVVEVV
jgi:hypothetical protein